MITPGSSAGAVVAVEGAVSITGTGVPGVASSANAVECGSITAAIAHTVIARCRSMDILWVLPILNRASGN